jgi:hypothetical protein
MFVRKNNIIRPQRFLGEVPVKRNPLPLCRINNKTVVPALLIDDITVGINRVIEQSLYR